METTPENNFATEVPAAPVRPQFLSVLCILTWIACGLILITTLWGVAFKKSAEEQFQEIENMREVNPEIADQMEAMYAAQDNSNQTAGLAINLVALGLSAFGAYMMWQLKKNGFYVYVAGEVIPYFGLMTGGSQALLGMGGEGLMATAIGVMIVLDLAFIIMYAVNLKHMRA